MLKIIHLRYSSLYFKCKIIFLVACLLLVCSEVSPCSPGRSGARRRSARKLTPLVFKQHVPNIPEHSLGASGPPEGRIWRDDARFKNLVPNYNSDIVFKDEEGTGVDRLMTRRCKEKLDILAISVMNMWPGVILRVTEGFDEEGHHPKNSLHYEGRAVAISTSDRDTSKYGMLARLAVDAGFDWVFFESRAHIYCSVKTESPVSSRFSGCFHGSTQVITKSGVKSLDKVKVGEEIAVGISNASVIYSKVIDFLHRDPHFVANFIQINTSSNNSLLVTEEHLVFRHTWAPVYASSIVPGDFIWIMSDNENLEKCIVTAINFVTLKGVYAPLTIAGTIVADRVVSSCYAVINSHDLAHVVFWPLRLAYELRDIVELFFRYLRFPALNGNVTYIINKESSFQSKNKDSYIHWYAVFLCKLSGIFITICK